MKNFLLASLLVLTLFNCKKKNDPSPVNNNAPYGTSECGTLTVKKGNVSYNLTTFNNTLYFEKSESARRLDIRGTVDGGIFVISVSNFDFQNPPENGIKVKTYYEDYLQNECKKEGEISYCDGLLGTYLKNNKTLMTVNDEGKGSVVISSIDTNKKRVSGAFNFTVESLESSEQSDSIPFSGSFSNVCYTVLNRN